MKFIQILCAVIFPFILSTGLNASDGRGLEIAAEADNRDIGFGDTISTMTMTLYDQYGNLYNLLTGHHLLFLILLQT